MATSPVQDNSIGRVNSGATWRIAKRRDVPVVNLSGVTRGAGADLEPMLSRMELPELVLEADSIINLPVVKTHVLTGISCALKNHWGLLPTAALPVPSGRR